MPNWCQNKLLITGPKEDVILFMKKASGPTQSYNDYVIREEWPINDDIRIRARMSATPDLGEHCELSFHALYPVPEEVRRLPYDTARAKKAAETLGLPISDFTMGGYSWENKYWGCKWGATDVGVELGRQGEARYEFSTPWSEPHAFFNKVAEDWPTLTFHLDYTEPGGGFAGFAKWELGDCSEATVWNLEEPEGDEYEE